MLTSCKALSVVAMSLVLKRLSAPRLEARSSSEPQLSRLPPGLTVDELPRYRRRRPPQHLCPQDNLRPARDASFKAVKSEYRRRFLSYPLQASTEQASQYVRHGSPARAPLLRRRTSLRTEGDLLVRESELRARFKRLQGAQRAELARRPTTLRMEGEMETRTEHLERFCEPGSGARRAELSKRRTQLQLEGELARDTESRASFAPPAPPAERRPQLRRRATNLRLDADQSAQLSSEYRALFADFPLRDPPVRRRPPQGNLAPGPGQMEKVTEKRAHFVDWTGVAERPRPHRRSSSLKLEMEMAGGSGGGAVLPEYRERFVEFPAVARPAAASRAQAQSLRLEGDLLTETEKSAQFVDHYSPVARRRQRPPSGGDPEGSGTGALPPLATAAQRPAAGKRSEDQATRDQQEERRLQRLQEQRRQRQLEEQQREQQARLIQLQRELRARAPPAGLEPVFPATAPGFRDQPQPQPQAQAPLSRGLSLDSPAARRRAQRRPSQASATGAAPATATATPPTPRKAPNSPARTPPTPRKVRARHQYDKSPPHTPKKSTPKKAPATPRVGSPSPSVGSGRRRPASASPHRQQQQQQQEQAKGARPADTQLQDAEESAANLQSPPPQPQPQPQQLLAVPVSEEKPAQPTPGAVPQTASLPPLPPPAPAPAPAPAPESKSSSGCIGGTTDRRLTKLRPEPEAAERRRLRPAAPGEVYRAFHVLEKPEKTVTFEMDVRPPTRGRSVSRSGRGSRCSDDRGSCSLDRALSPGYRMHVLNVDDNGNSAPQRQPDVASTDTEGTAAAPRPTSPTARRASSPLPLPRRRGSHIRRDNARHAFIVLDNDNGNNDNGNNSNLNNNNNTTRSGMLDVPRGRGGWVPSWYNAPTSI
ncbi:serine/arginine repetitive matrix protein 1-like [Schistocerca gregaria]|uniref:serine/arginine repetitive matrix protein 1-like n=1 Tax=Schistocerca gregaria TaxID=7010 RepID=UPI00211F00F9|nr:serine/arginine repetitive matrix protein 1-like [Schistocerca gregaria]